MRSNASVSIAALIAGLVISLQGGSGQEAPGGIKVTAVGEVSVKPDTVIIRGEFSVGADTAADALTKYRDGRRRAVKMIESLGIESMTVTGPGPAMAVAPSIAEGNAIRNMMGNFDNQQDVDSKVHVREPLTISIGNLSNPDVSADTVAKVLDKAKEAGIKMGGTEFVPQYFRIALGLGYTDDSKEPQAAPIVYVVTDRAKLEEAACVKAMEDARRRAEMLARLASRKLGRVISVTQDDISHEKPSFDGVIRARLQVVFELER